MPLTTTALDAMAGHLASIAAEVSLHSADPAGTGANETSAGRQAPAFTVANGGLTLSADENFTGGAAGGGVTHVGLWNATGGFLGGFQIVSGDLTFNAAGEYTLEELAISGS